MSGNDRTVKIRVRDIDNPHASSNKDQKLWQSLRGKTRTFIPVSRTQVDNPELCNSKRLFECIDHQGICFCEHQLELP